MKRLVLQFVVWQLIILWAALPVAEAGATDIRMECVIFPKAVAIVVDCDDCGDDCDGGCYGRLAEASPNFYSQRHQHSGPAFGQSLLCDIPSAEAERGAARYSFPDGNHWVTVKCRITTDDEARLAAPDANAVPPDSTAQSYWLAEWCCDRTTPSLDPHHGSYAVITVGKRELQQSSAADLIDFASWDFVTDPSYATAYYDIVAGYQLASDDESGHRNPNPDPESTAAVIHGMKARWAVFDQMPLYGADETRCATGRAVCEDYLQRYGYEDQTRTLWSSETGELHAAWDHVFALTTPSNATNDPELMYGDVDVAVEPGEAPGLEQISHGAVKARYLPIKTTHE
jgi:hypothetical protein